jgi:hypothetical protein
MRITTITALAGTILVAAGGGVAAAGSHSSPAKLLGTYVRTVTKADIARTNSFRREGPGQTPPPPGMVHLTFTAHSFKVVDFTGFGIGQTYSATPTHRLNVIAYTNPGKGAFCGPEIPQNASYKWSISGRTFTLKATSDRCADRDTVLGGRWTRVR